MPFQLTPSAMPAGYGEALLPLDDVKDWLRVLDEDEDLLIEALRDAAIGAVEQYTGVMLGPRSGIVATFDRFGCGMRMGIGPAASVVVDAVSYIDSEGADVALEASDWRVVLAGELKPAIGTSWPVSGGPVTVNFAAGFADGECPPQLLLAAKMFVARLFINREAVAESGMTGDHDMGFRALCDPFRMPVI